MIFAERRRGAINLSPSGGVGNYTYNWSTGSTSCCLTGLLPGTYFVTVTDNNNCPKSQSFTINGSATALMLTESHQDISCHGANDGSVVLTATGGTSIGNGDYLFAKQGEAFLANNSFNNLAAGTHTFEVKDANDCIQTISVILSQPQLISLSANVTQVSCSNGNDGAIDLSITAPDPYSISWSNNETTEDLDNLTAGTYTVTITYNNDPTCTKVESFDITEPAPFYFSATIQDDFCNDGNGQINLDITGGTLPYTFTWADGPSGSARPNLVAGTYTVSLTDGRNCIVDTSIQITAPTKLLVSHTGVEPSCSEASDGAIQFNILGGTAPYRFQLNGGTEEPLSGSEYLLDNLPKGGYGLTVLDSKDCSYNWIVNLGEPDPLTLEATTENISCSGGMDGSIQLIPGGGAGAYSVSWTDGSTLLERTGLTAGTYEVILSTNANCSITKSYTITEPTSLSANETIQHDECLEGNGSIQLAPSGGTPFNDNSYTYLWSNGNTLSSITNLSSATYTVSIKDANDCELIKNIAITGPAQALAITETIDDVDCNGGADGAISLTVIGGTAPYTYAWSNGATTASISNLMAISYSVTVIDSKGCQIEESYILTQPNPLQVTASKQMQVVQELLMALLILLFQVV